MRPLAAGRFTFGLLRIRGEHLSSLFANSIAAPRSSPVGLAYLQPTSSRPEAGRPSGAGNKQRAARCSARCQLPYKLFSLSRKGDLMSLPNAASGRLQVAAAQVIAAGEKP
mgnify:CR=1 FL=1